jgi:hypothetical protein
MWMTIVLFIRKKSLRALVPLGTFIDVCISPTVFSLVASLGVLVEAASTFLIGEAVLPVKCLDVSSLPVVQIVEPMEVVSML